MQLRASARRASLFTPFTRLYALFSFKEVGYLLIFSYIMYINKKVMKLLKILLITTTAAVMSCSEEDVRPSLCQDGVCDGMLSIPYTKDSNGYYHVDLNFEGDYLPRFSIIVEADDVDPFYYYNDTGVVQSAFESNSFWVMGNGVEVGIVQETTIYLNNSPENTEYTPTITGRKWGKRIIGPIPNEFVGDTIVIRAEIYWDGGSNSASQLFEEKFIIE